jgi:HlyD family secretion protein
MMIDNAALRFMPSAKDLAAYSDKNEDKKTMKTTEAMDNKTKKVWTLRDDVLVPIAITTGLTDGRMTEVTGGDLKQGTSLIIGTEYEDGTQPNDPVMF